MLWTSSPGTIVRVEQTLETQMHVSGSRPLVHAPKLAARQRELALLLSAFEATQDGRTRLALVAGEPGIGKTRLLDEVAERAIGDGALVLRGRASEAEGMPPYLPFIEALGQHIRTTDAEVLRAQSAGLAAVLAKLLPELAARVGELPATYALPPEQARLRLFQALAAFIAAPARTRPLLLILDDLHWADPASLDLLCYLARQQHGHEPDARQAPRLLILGAYRAGEVAQNAAFQRALAELNRSRMLIPISLQPLAEDDVARLAAGYLSGHVDARLARLLYAQSEGNPFFAEELLRSWIEMNAVDECDGSWSLRAPIVPALPATIVGAVRERVARLAPEVANLLRIAAVIGRTFNLPILAEVADEDAELVEERLRTAHDAQILRRDADPMTWTFGHDTIRECLYGEVTAVRRRRLHTTIGRALEARGGEDAQSLAELAFHWAHSDDDARCLVYARRAAEQAMATYAAHDALAHYRTALKLLDRAAAGNAGVRRGDVLLGLGEAALLAGDARAALDAFDSARVWFARTGDRLAAARAAHLHGRAAWRLEDLAMARVAFVTALGLLDGYSCDETVEVLVDLGALLAVSLHELDTALVHGKQALDLAQHLEDERLMAAASRTLGTMLVRANNLPGGIALLEEALALAGAANDPTEAAECCAHLFMAYGWSAAVRSAEAILVRQLEYVRRTHDPFVLRHIDANHAVVYVMQGRLVEAARMLDRAQAVVDTLASPEPAAFVDYMRGLLAFHQGDYPTAERMLAMAIARLRSIGPGALVWYLGMHGIVQLAQGKRAEAVACMEEVEMLIAPLPPGSMPTSEPLTHLTWMALMLDDGERVERYAPRLHAFRGQYHDFLVDRLLGQVAMRRGDWSAAEADLAAAETTARQEHIRAELAHTLMAQVDLAQARGARGSPSYARARLEEALALFQGLPNPVEERRLRDRLRRGVTRGQGDGRPELPAGLSRREVEVLRLLAAGKSNREIAEMLVLSEKTVVNHLTNVYAKTGADNRAAAAAFAIRNGLA